MDFTLRPARRDEVTQPRQHTPQSRPQQQQPEQSQWRWTGASIDGPSYQSQLSGNAFTTATTNRVPSVNTVQKAHAASPSTAAATASPKPRIAISLPPSSTPFHPVTDVDDVDVVLSDVTPKGRRATVEKRAQQDHTPPPRVTSMSTPSAARSAPTFSSSTVKHLSSSAARHGDEPVSRGRGRPKGWRPGMSYSVMRGKATPREMKAMRAAAAARAAERGDGVVRRRGRPPKAPSPPLESIYGRLRPDFLAYLCEWDGCKAELHNLGTLRRHIYKVHVREDGKQRCLWGDCQTDPSARPDYTTAEDLRVHVEEAHLVPMGWHVGDGPDNNVGYKRNMHEDDAAAAEAGVERSGTTRLPAYLMDSHGNQVTPSIADQEVEDPETWKRNRMKLRELLRRRDANLPSEDESDEDGDGESGEEGSGL